MHIAHEYTPVHTAANEDDSEAEETRGGGAEGAAVPVVELVDDGNGELVEGEGKTAGEGGDESEEENGDDMEVTGEGSEEEAKDEGEEQEAEEDELGGGAEAAEGEEEAGSGEDYEEVPVAQVVRIHARNHALIHFLVR